MRWWLGAILALTFGADPAWAARSTGRGSAVVTPAATRSIAPKPRAGRPSVKPVTAARGGSAKAAAARPATRVAAATHRMRVVLGSARGAVALGHSRGGKAALHARSGAASERMRVLLGQRGPVGRSFAMRGFVGRAHAAPVMRSVGWHHGLPPAAGVQADGCPSGTMAMLARGHDDVVRCMPI